MWSQLMKNKSFENVPVLMNGRKGQIEAAAPDLTFCIYLVGEILIYSQGILKGDICGSHE